MYGLVNTVPPVSEPVSVATLKSHLRISFSTEDSLLATYITTARTLFEEWTQRQLMPATWTLYLDDWSKWQRAWGWQRFGHYQTSWPQTNWWQQPILLPKPPLTAVTGIQYRDLNNTLQTLATSNYVVDNTFEPARLLWTGTLPSLAGNQIPLVQITYTAGYSSVPTPIQHAIMLLAASLYRDREATTSMTLCNVPMGFKSLVDIYKVGEVLEYGL